MLESLSGYLLLGQRLLEGQRELAQGWNFGPEAEGNRTVAEVLTQLHTHWPELTWQTTAHPQPHEANLLYLDSTLAKTQLGWKPIWSLQDALIATADWYRNFLATGHVDSRAQLTRYITAAHATGVKWSAG